MHMAGSHRNFLILTTKVLAPIGKTHRQATGTTALHNQGCGDSLKDRKSADQHVSGHLAGSSAISTIRPQMGRYRATEPTVEGMSASLSLCTYTDLLSGPRTQSCKAFICEFYLLPPHGSYLPGTDLRGVGQRELQA